MTSTFQVTLRNRATGGRVTKVFGVDYTTREEARRCAQRLNERQGREGRNVCWGVREVTA